MPTPSKEQMWAASGLASSMSENGLPSNYKDRSDYKQAKFLGDVYPFVGNKINKGYAGLADIGVIIAFAGTEGAEDWKNNFLANQVSFSAYGAGSVHEGFYKAVTSICDSMIDKIKTLTSVPKSFYITGHSKGGAMATLMSVILKKKISGLINSLNVMTFGAPRVGDKIFKDNYNIDLVRYEANLDVVPHVPLTEQEKIVLPALSTLIDFVDDMITFPSYWSVGRKICIEKDHGRYSGIPCDTNNSKGEILNSFCASFGLVTARQWSLIGDVHTGDYKS